MNFRIVVIVFSLIGRNLPVKAEDICNVTAYEDIQNAVSNCSTIVLKDVEIPANTTLELHLNNNTELIFDGRLTHVPVDLVGYLVTIYGNGLTITGTKDHVLDGMGPQHWNGKNETIIMRPNLLMFKVTNTTIKNLNILNCANHCTHISDSSDVIVSNIFIDNREGYPGVAPVGKFAANTDGIGISGSTEIYISDVVVFNQDDCVAITKGQNIFVENLFCNGSHGLSLSVGGGDVSNVIFKDSILTQPRQAIHLKTHNDGTDGHIYNILYENILFLDAFKMGISIQQNYPSGELRGNVPITNLTLLNVHGTVLSDAIPVSILCAEGACSDWNWINVTVSGTQSNNECENIPENMRDKIVCS